MLVSLMVSAPIMVTANCRNFRGFRVSADGGFPSFLPKEIERIKDPYARKLAKRIERLPVQISFSKNSILSSCVKPLTKNEKHPLVLLHGFDSSCLEWRCTYPLLEEAGLETWAVDILGWGFSDLGTLPSCNVSSKREHLYQLWKSYIRKPMILVGPSLGAAVAIDFAFNHSEASVCSDLAELNLTWMSYTDSFRTFGWTSLLGYWDFNLGYAVLGTQRFSYPTIKVEKLVLIDASVYTEGTGKLSTLPRTVAYAGVSLLKSTPLRMYANFLAFNRISFGTNVDWTNAGRLHCLLPWWKDATVDFMISGGYNVSRQIKQIKQETLIIWGEDDQIISNKVATRLNSELPNSILHQIPNSGHLPHVEKPDSVAKLIVDFVRGGHN